MSYEYRNSIGLATRDYNTIYQAGAEPPLRVVILSEAKDLCAARREILRFAQDDRPIEKNIEHVRIFQQLQSQLLRKYENIEPHLRVGSASNPDLLYPLLTLRYGIHRCQSLLAWCEETLATLQAL